MWSQGNPEGVHILRRRLLSRDAIALRTQQIIPFFVKQQWSFQDDRRSYPKSKDDDKHLNKGSFLRFFGSHCHKIRIPA
jgi:hypothetical protein